jgi:hypothetical protein
MQASSSVCSTGSAADSDSSINSDVSSSSGDESVRIREETTSEEPLSPVYLSLLSASARPIQKVKRHMVSRIGPQSVMSEGAGQPVSGLCDSASAEQSAEEIEEMTSFKSKEEIEEIAKVIENAFGKEMRQTYMAFEGNVDFFCTMISAMMQPLFKQHDQTQFVFDVCKTATCMEQYFHFAMHLYDALEMCKHIVGRVNLSSSKIVACMASMRNYAAVLAPAQDVAQVQRTIQKCQFILDKNEADVARIKHDVEKSRQTIQPIIALIKQTCCEGSEGADSDSSINSDVSSSSGDESVRIREETTSEEPLSRSAK